MHHFTIIGLDRSYCDRCKQWIVSTTELEKLKKTAEKISDKKAQKEWRQYIQALEKNLLKCP